MTDKIGHQFVDFYGVCYFHCWLCNEITNTENCFGLKTLELIDEDGEKYEKFKGYCSKVCWYESVEDEIWFRECNRLRMKRNVK